jgi:hypothetical protein
MVRLRIDGDTVEEVRAVADTIESFFAEHIVFTPVKEGQNPKYVGRQKFFVYATLSPNLKPHRL